MASNARFAEVAAVAADPARASMLQALMGGRALTAVELAEVADITPQKTSRHLRRMTEVGVLSVHKQGRHRFHRLAGSSIAHMLESIMQVAAEFEPDDRTGTLRQATSLAAYGDQAFSNSCSLVRLLR